LGEFFTIFSAVSGLPQAALGQVSLDNYHISIRTKSRELQAHLCL
jgi:hypothetical protein